MGIELWTNNAKSTLAGDITNSATSLTVGSGHGSRYPNPSGTDYFFVTLDDGVNIEIVKCTARSTDVFTVTRAQQGTTGTAFTTGTLVELRPTKQGLSDLQLTSGITSVAYASRSAADKPGRLFLPSDGFVIERDTGTAYAPWGPIYPLTAPVDGDFVWINQGGASVTTTQGGIYLLGPATAGVSMRIRKKAAPSPPYTITAAILPICGRSSGYPLFGLCWRKSGAEAQLNVRFGVYQASGALLRLQLAKMTSATAFSANYFDEVYSSAPLNPLWLQISDNNTNRICRVSRDGQNFIQVHSVSRTDFVTADEVGFFADAGDTTYDVGANLISWKET